MAKTLNLTFPEAQKSEYYTKRWRDGDGGVWYCVYERIIPNEEGICIAEYKEPVHAYTYMEELNGIR